MRQGAGGREKKDLEALAKQDLLETLSRADFSSSLIFSNFFSSFERQQQHHQSKASVILEGKQNLFDFTLLVLLKCLHDLNTLMCKRSFNISHCSR